MLSLDRSLIKTQVILLSWGDIVQSDLEVRNIPVSTEDWSLLNEANAKLQTAVVSLTAENRGLQTSISRLEKTQTVMYELLQQIHETQCASGYTSFWNLPHSTRSLINSISYKFDEREAVGILWDRTTAPKPSVRYCVLRVRRNHFTWWRNYSYDEETTSYDEETILVMKKPLYLMKKPVYAESYCEETSMKL